jgi:predicted RNase H-like HicB family nuclease
MDIFQIEFVCASCGKETKGVISSSVQELTCQACNQQAAKVKQFAGVVYVMSNPNIPNFVKVGRTNRDVFRRAQQVSGTGVPGAYQVDAIFPSHRPEKDEAKAHNKLARFRDDKEHFKIDAASAIVKVKTALKRDPAFVSDEWRSKVTELVKENQQRMLEKLGSRR